MKGTRGTQALDHRLQVDAVKLEIARLDLPTVIWLCSISSAMWGRDEKSGAV
jgi:hypothetical protein